MTTEEKVLFKKIQNFQLDDNSASFKFSERLARENGWDKSYTNRVIEEYKKFIFLCCISETGITPSDAVDQAWHLHLTFTKSYWIDLCKNTINKEIHHNPTKGGSSERQKFKHFYQKTDILYTEKFGTNPPTDIWYDSKKRFSEINFQRVNLQKHWLIPKPNLSFFSKTLVLSCIPFVILQVSPSATLIIALLFIGIFVFWIVGITKSASNKNENSIDGGSGCSTIDTSHSSHSNDGDSGCSGDGGDSGCSGCGGCGGD
jgi:hypothetical protein